MVLGLAGVASVPASVAAQEGEWVNRRVLNGHQFIPNSRIPDPFGNSWVRSGTGLGWAVDLEVPIVDIEGDSIGSLEGDIAFLNLDFEYQQRVADWLALRVGFGGAARLGTDEQSLLFQGVSGLYGFSVGATVPIVQTETLAFSAVGDANWNQLYAINPLSFVEKALEEGFDPGGDNELVESGSNFRGSLGGRFAWASSGLFGLTAFAEAGGASPFRSGVDDNQGVFSFGGTLDFDLAPLGSVPIGFQLGFRGDNFSEGGDDIVDNVWLMTLGVFYTGRQDFAIGLETAGSRLELRDADKTISSGTLRLAMRYYF